MHFLKKFYNNTLKYDIINKFHCEKIEDLTSLRKIILNFGCKTADMKQLSSCLLSIELITNQKGKLTRTKYSKIIFKIRKGNATGCKVTLNKINRLRFIELLIVEIFPKLKSFTGFNGQKFKNNSCSCKLEQTLVFSQLEKNYYLFNNLPELDISIVLSSNCDKEELYFLLNSYQLPFND